MELEKLVTIWQSLVEKRKQLKEQAEKIEKAETQLEEVISGLLASRGMLGAKLPIGTVARKVIWSARLSDADAFARLQYSKMREIAVYNESIQNTEAPVKSMLDGLLMQRRPLKEGVEAMAKEICEKQGIDTTPENIAAVVKPFGINYMPIAKLSFTKK